MAGPPMDPAFAFVDQVGIDLRRSRSALGRCDSRDRYLEDIPQAAPQRLITKTNGFVEASCKSCVNGARSVRNGVGMKLSKGTAFSMGARRRGVVRDNEEVASQTAFC